MENESIKVLHVINSLATGGAEKLILDSLPIYKEKGLQVDLFLLNGRETPFLNKLKEENIKVIRSKYKSFYNPLHILELTSLIHRYDLIHVHLFPALYWVGLSKLLVQAKVKLIYTEHNTSNRRRGNLILNMTDKLIYKIYHKLITISPEVDKNLRDYLNFSNLKFQLIPNGVNLEEIRRAEPVAKTLFLNKDDICILQVSSFRPQKDQETLIKSLLYLPENFKILLVGDGPLRGKVEENVKKRKLEKRVIFLGIRSDIPQLLKMADIVVLSSYYEGLSLSSIEGMASGKPFLASDVPGLHNIVKDAGILFPLGDSKTLSSEVLKLVQDKFYYQTISERVVERAGNYDVKVMVDKYFQVYEELVDVN
ncbi:Glycosyltransferase involved in cell wall bisynthesis [Salegentibacter agarivorans]|uniref:Glycosyltransferase involved in cell wall bisynthesis n=1 Tax=Salegentibacter agarivorans TaxID=345907 RepID=A0A1I2K1W1_9FLAO|nr:glycosyltransferase [Salegentibacter agarivorans]SFF60298.1 Glycosyltransferase involved in cell wall bisynthesis [Salegentibacter agarivorans]